MPFDTSVDRLCDVADDFGNRAPIPVRSAALQSAIGLSGDQVKRVKPWRTGRHLQDALPVTSSLHHLSPIKRRNADATKPATESLRRQARQTILLSLLRDQFVRPLPGVAGPGAPSRNLRSRSSGDMGGLLPGLAPEGLDMSVDAPLGLPPVALPPGVPPGRLPEPVVLPEGFPLIDSDRSRTPGSGACAVRGGFDSSREVRSAWRSQAGKASATAAAMRPMDNLRVMTPSFG